jgi:hypothetical protein
VATFQRTGDRAAAIAAVFFLYMHVTVFTLSVDATSYVYVSKIFPTPVRAKGMGISVSGLFFATIIFTSGAPSAFTNIGWQYYLVFVILTAAIAVMIFFWFPEVCNAMSGTHIESMFLTMVLYTDSETLARGGSSLVRRFCNRNRRRCRRYRK